jgi:hypothetical protein
MLSMSSRFAHSLPAYFSRALPAAESASASYRLCSPPHNSVHAREEKTLHTKARPSQSPMQSWVAVPPPGEARRAMRLNFSRPPSHKKISVS